MLMQRIMKLQINSKSLWFKNTWVDSGPNARSNVYLFVFAEMSFAFCLITTSLLDGTFTIETDRCSSFSDLLSGLFKYSYVPFRDVYIFWGFIGMDRSNLDLELNHILPHTQKNLDVLAALGLFLWGRLRLHFDYLFLISLRTNYKWSTLITQHKEVRKIIIISEKLL